MEAENRDWKNEIPMPTDKEHQKFLDNVNQYMGDNKSNINYVDYVSKTIKEYRVRLDEAISIIKNIKPSREVSIAITSSQNGRMWLGKALQSLDQPNPYPDSKNASNTKIEPTADVCNKVNNLDDIAHVQKVKIMRKRLTDLYDDIEKLQDEECLINPYNKLGFISIHKAWGYIVEANLWLGCELGRINEENNK